MFLHLYIFGFCIFSYCRLRYIWWSFGSVPEKVEISLTVNRNPYHNCNCYYVASEHCDALYPDTFFAQQNFEEKNWKDLYSTL